MSAAKKQPIEPVEEASEELSDELAFDVKNDWRKEADSTQTNLFKEDDMEMTEEEMDTSIFSLDTGGEVKKESLKEHAKAQKEAMKHARRKKSGEDSDTLKALQAAAQGGEAGDVDELEILTEEDRALVNDPIFTNKGDLYPQIHGNYFLLDHLVDGGMAKVCRARYLGEGDEADKMVAIKMVQEKFSADESFVQMFVDEIKVSFGLNHPNINTTFDYGKIGKNLFVSMEYIHGKDLMVVIDKLKAQKKTIPVPMAIMIASKMSEALHYAHNFTNQLTGQKYNIVHRDISPHNAMVSYDGFVKVIDFGIAKADTNTTEEEEGTIKGKINYFAPEYLEGKKIDHRYDQFAVALTLWEMLTARKTFTGADQLLTLKTILECKPDLASKYNKKVPKALDKIIMKALSKDPANRYKDMEAFNKALMKMLYQTYPDFHESDISKMMKVLFKKDYERDLEKFKGFGQYSIKEIVAKIEAYKVFQQNQKEKAQRSGKEVMEFDFGFGENTVSIRGKSNLESLIANRKKKKPGEEKEGGGGRRSRQQTIASMLDDEDSVSTVSAFERNKGKILFLSLIALGFFQKELIVQTLFSSGEMLDPAQTAVVQKQVRQQKKKMAEQTKKDRERKAFLRKLQKEKALQAAKNQPAQPKRQVAKQKVRPQKEAPVVNVNVGSKQLVDQILNKDKKKPVARAVAPKVERGGSAPIKNINISSKQMVDQLLNKKKAATVESNRPVARPTAQRKPASAPVVEDIDSLSFEELKKKMEAQLAERKRKLLEKNDTSKQVSAPKEPSVDRVPSNTVVTPPTPTTESSVGSGRSNTALGSGSQINEEGLTETTGEESEEIETNTNSETTENSQRAQQNLNNLMNQGQASAIEAQLDKAQEEYTNEAEDISLSNSVSELQEKLKAQNSPNPSAVPAPNAPEASPQPVKPNEPSAQSELKDLQARMAKLIEEEKKRQEEPRIEKVDISLSDEEKDQATVAEEAAPTEDPDDIQRDLASRLKEMDDPANASETPESKKESGVVDGVVDFLKSRRAFGWMFD